MGLLAALRPPESSHARARPLRFANLPGGKNNLEIDIHPKTLFEIWLNA